MTADARQDDRALAALRQSHLRPPQEAGAARSLRRALRRFLAWSMLVLGAVPALLALLFLAIGQPLDDAAGEAWFRTHAASLNLAQAAVQRGLWPALWSDAIAPVLLLPAWQVLALWAGGAVLLGALLFVVRAPRIRFAERGPAPGFAPPAAGKPRKAVPPAAPAAAAKIAAPQLATKGAEKGARGMPRAEEMLAAARRLAGGSGARDEDLEFMPDVAAAARRVGHRFAYLLTLISVAFLVVFVVWSNFAVLDEVTRGEAKVIPSSRTQVVQNLEGGIVSEILVREGRVVDKGDVLLRIENVTAASTYREDRRRYLNLLASAARLEAEIAGTDEIQFPQAVLDEAPEAAVQQRRQLESRRGQIAAQIGVLQAQVEQRRQEIEEMRSRRTQLESTLALSREELAIAEPLVRQGVMPRLEQLRIQQRIAETDGELRTIRLSIPRAQTALGEAEKRIEEVRATARVDAGREMNQQRGDLEAVAEGMAAGVDRVTRSEVRSPVRGTVKSLAFNTVGGVIQPGQNIMEIVPLADTLLIEAKIRPADIAFLRPGQHAKVKITAYDFSIYGGLDATVEQISADTIQDEEKKEHFYRVQLRSETGELMHNGQELPIIPGMTATVDILTGKKSVFAYLMKPVLKARDQALKER